ncbi:Ketosteroid isomerase homolog [Xaviernesmea oryzae]|uniref:Ketosteroid isomerase homolog n=1 Tax=Xaviernesmea oryzae TaxID=464029 RepID=A0A1X7FWJ1_9HYPH|nr:nuclear transport factor 2 family protein [Xaviernesmea oryzae]SMF60006.1 Ketosteroid isomerase homolog [Xaviernesmea oryzae]
MISTLGLSVLAALALAPEICNTSTRDEARDIEAVTAQAAEAHAHLMRGDIAAYRRTIQTAPNFVLMDPFGGAPTGNPKSDAHWEQIGRFFRSGRDARFNLIASYRSDDMIVLVANEYAHVAVGSLPAQDWTLRVTLVFRRDADRWLLAHRHADPLAAGISLKDAGQITLGSRASNSGLEDGR